MARKKKPRREKYVQHLSPQEAGAVRLAGRNGLYLLIDGTPAARVWRLYDPATGRELGWYSPGTTRYRIGGREGSGEPGDVIRAAVEARRSL